ncbi:hypothetical protein GCM10022221_69070 [Actinocorallia aurea]
MLRLADSGTLPEVAENAEVLWVGLDGDLAVLAELAGRCAETGRTVGLTVPPRGSTPHLTVVRDLRVPAAGLSAFEDLPGLVVHRFDAPLFFADADTLRADLRRLVEEADPPVRLVVVNAEVVYDMDTTGVETLHRVLDELKRHGTRLALARVRNSVCDLLQATGREERVGPHRIYPRAADAVTGLPIARPVTACGQEASRVSRAGELTRLGEGDPATAQFEDHEADDPAVEDDEEEGRGAVDDVGVQLRGPADQPPLGRGRRERGPHRRGEPFGPGEDGQPRAAPPAPSEIAAASSVSSATSRSVRPEPAAARNEGTPRRLGGPRPGR